MSLYIKNIINYIGDSKLYVKKIANKIAVKAKRNGKSFKEYIHDNENVGHISLVVYDVLPLIFKFAIRYENFNKVFTHNFSFIREKLFDSSVKEAEDLVKTVNDEKIISKSPVRKKASKKPKLPLEIVAKPIAKNPVKKVAVKKSTPVAKVTKKIK